MKRRKENFEELLNAENYQIEEDIHPEEVSEPEVHILVRKRSKWKMYW